MNPYQSPQTSDVHPSPGRELPGLKLGWWSVLLAGVICGGAVGALSLTFTSHIEPWDSSSGYYVYALFLAGLAATLPHPKWFWLAPVGVVLGQLVYMLMFLPVGPLVLFGVLHLTVRGAFALGGAVVAVMGFYLYGWLQGKNLIE